MGCAQPAVIQAKSTGTAQASFARQFEYMILLYHVCVIASSSLALPQMELWGWQRTKPARYSVYGLRPTDASFTFRACPWPCSCIRWDVSVVAKDSIQALLMQLWPNLTRCRGSPWTCTAAPDSIRCLSTAGAAVVKNGMMQGSPWTCTAALGGSTRRAEASCWPRGSCCVTSTWARLPGRPLRFR